ncbi:GNAT family N-acetyltransferase [Halosolutus gelatinilyticus]|uniref:GNAT family N-acetyltransferase n=1 Tax=Halosolutus gelatinilyticus TaxID=2931975 RepID=UPI001FF6F47F|nr:GNAT family N-acetyltransferase [Halosolutus gelatinilyticus]
MRSAKFRLTLDPPVQQEGAIAARRYRHRHAASRADSRAVDVLDSPKRSETTAIGPIENSDLETLKWGSRAEDAPSVLRSFDCRPGSSATPVERATSSCRRANIFGVRTGIRRYGSRYTDGSLRRRSRRPKRSSRINRGVAGTDYIDEQVAAWAHDHDLERYPIESDGTYFVVAERDDRIVGFGWMKPDADDYFQRPIRGEITAIYVHPSITRRGVGSRTHDELEAHARRESVEVLGLWASRNAVAFYEAHGYDRVAEHSLEFHDARDLSLRCARPSIDSGSRRSRRSPSVRDERVERLAYRRRRSAATAVR